MKEEDKVEEMISPWLTEPEREEFEHCGFKCLILRHEHIGHLCGYVGLPESHPWFGVGYNQCFLACDERGLHMGEASSEPREDD